jgi:hypothetical protein
MDKFNIMKKDIKKIKMCIMEKSEINDEIYNYIPPHKYNTRLQKRKINYRKNNNHNN